MKKILSQIPSLHILVIGDLMLDHYIWGDASRISPEAPVPVVHVERDTFTAGGAANVALNLRSLCSHVSLFGFLGGDNSGKQLKKLMADAGVQLLPGCQSEDLATILKARVVVRGQQLCRLDREDSPEQYCAAGQSIDDSSLKQAVESADAVILSDYAKGILSSSLVNKVRNWAGAKSIPITYDPKPRRRLDCSGMTLMTPNRAESLEMAGLEKEAGSHGQEAFPAEAVCQAIWQKYKPQYLVITLGSDGMLLSEAGKILDTIPAFSREVFDVSGAGDTVISALTLGLATGVNLHDAANFANMSAGVVVGKLGTAIVTPEEVLAYAAAHNS